MTVSIITIETPSLGDRTYLAHDGQVAVVVDPQRDIDRVLAAAHSLLGHGRHRSDLVEPDPGLLHRLVDHR